MKKISLSSTVLAAALSFSPALLHAEPSTPAKPSAPAIEEKTEGEKKVMEEKKADFEITVTCNDAMQFDKKEIEVPLGKLIKLTLKNVGKAPKIAMGHNLVILNKGASLQPWAMKAMSARDSEFVPSDEESMKAVLAHTKLLGPDEEDAVTFTLTEAGEYEFLCSFPGHFSLMRGKLIAK